MSDATLIDIASTASARLLEDVSGGLHGRDSDERRPAFHRLEAALGRDFAQPLVAALSKEALHRLEAALSRDFADRSRRSRKSATKRLSAALPGVVGCSRRST